MGGPGVSIHVCGTHLEAIQAELRKLRESPQVGSALIADAVVELAEAQMALAWVETEFRRTLEYAERLEAEVAQYNQEAAPRAPASPVRNSLPKQLDPDGLWFQVMIAGADKGFRSLDSFVGWFVGGTGAAVALVLANMNELGPYFHQVNLARVTSLVIWAFAAVVIAKFIGSLICTAAGSSEKAHEIFQYWSDRSSTALPSSEQFLQAKDKTTPWPLKQFGRLTGPSTPSRVTSLAMWGLMTAGILSIAAAILIAVAVANIATGIDFSSFHSGG